MGNPWGAVAVVIVALIGGGGLTAYFGTRLTNRTTRESSFIDDQAEKIKTLESKVLGIQGREYVRDDYIQVLRQHIADGLPPPPPPFPIELTGGHSS